MNKDIEDSMEEEFEFPEQILNSISEASPAGFYLFTISEGGEIEMFSHWNSDVADSGLRIKAAKILGGLDAVENQVIAQNLYHDQFGCPDEMDDEEIEDLEDSDE